MHKSTKHICSCAALLTAPALTVVLILMQSNGKRKSFWATIVSALEQCLSYVQIVSSGMSIEYTGALNVSHRLRAEPFFCVDIALHY